MPHGFSFVIPSRRSRAQDNYIARDLRTPKYRERTKPSEKLYSRKNKEPWDDYDLD